MGNPTALKLVTLYVGRVAFWPLLLATILVVALEAGAWKQIETHTGPFQPDIFAGSVERANLAVGFAISGINPAKCCLSIRTDQDKHPTQSDLRLWVNGNEIYPPHALHDQIRSGQSKGFSFWKNQVVFALPPGQANDKTAVAVVQYSLLPPRDRAFLLSLLTVLLGALVYQRSVAVIARRIGEVAQDKLRAGLLIVFYLCVLASVTYVISIIHAAIYGWAFPTTAIIRNSSSAEWLANNEIYLGYLLLTIAGLGVLAGPSPPSSRQANAAVRWFWPSAFVVVACLFVFAASAMWAGLARPGDFQGANIGGLIPFSDSGGHVASAYDQARDGSFSTFALRRPIAAAFRSALLFASSYSLPTMLLLQVVLLSMATCFAAWSVARWRGPWTALAFFALAYTYVRTFATLTLTEPLGLIWGLVSIPFFVEAIRCRSRKMALIALAMTTLGLMTRMGSMFTIPALLLWFFVAFGDNLKGRVRSGIAALSVVACIFAANFALQKLHGTAETVPGSNFSYTLCGLTIGTTWDGCLELPAWRSESGAPRSEAETVTKLYALAWENFKTDPSVLPSRVLESAQQFLVKLPSTMLDGYFHGREPWWFPRSALILLVMVGAGAYLLRRTGFELTFWALVLGSIIASAGFVFFDDGNRVLAVSFPLISLFAALAATELVAKNDRPTQPCPGLGTLGNLILAVSALALTTPWLAHAVYQDNAATREPSEIDIFGGKRMAGFLIVPDDAPLRHDVPTLHLKDFDAIVASSGIEYYQGVLRPEKPPAPFGFIFAPLASAGASDLKFIVPPEVIERSAVSKWRLQYRSWNVKSGFGQYWVYVTKATPVEEAGR